MCLSSQRYMMKSTIDSTIRRNMTRAQLREAGVCTQCKTHTAADGFTYCQRCRERSLTASRKWSAKERKNNPERVKDRAHREHLRLKAQVFDAYGGPRCACCEEDVFDLLTIDHVNNDGAEQRRKLGNGSTCKSRVVYAWLRRNNYPSGYQVLCFSCNAGRFLNGGVCPHKTRKDDDAARAALLALTYTPKYHLRARGR